MKQKREDLRKIPKTIKTQDNECFAILGQGDFSCLSKGTVIQDALHLKCSIWKLAFDKRSQTPTEKNGKVKKGSLPFPKPFFNSLVDPMSSRAGSIQPHFLKQV